MEKKIKLLPPAHMQNHIRIENNSATISITELSEVEAEEYGELIKQTFIAHWKKLKTK